MKAKIERSPRVAGDIDDIWLSIAIDNVRAADRIIETIADAVARLGEFPEMGRSRGELRPNLRSWTVGDYLIFYEAAPGVVTIQRIAHGARDLGDLLAEP
ncbi:MAG: plasmid stabilization system [Phenylobacterium sp.]|nr:plasmid stabilization system [Phenylobacterium sp.]